MRISNPRTPDTAFSLLFLAWTTTARDPEEWIEENEVGPEGEEDQEWDGCRERCPISSCIRKLYLPFSPIALVSLIATKGKRWLIRISHSWKKRAVGFSPQSDQHIRLLFVPVNFHDNSSRVPHIILSTIFIVHLSHSVICYYVRMTSAGCPPHHTFYYIYCTFIPLSYL